MNIGESSPALESQIVGQISSVAVLDSVKLRGVRVAEMLNHMFLALPVGAPGRIAAVELLTQRHGEVARFNQVWKTSFNAELLRRRDSCLPSHSCLYGARHFRHSGPLSSMAIRHLRRADPGQINDVIPADSDLVA